MHNIFISYSRRDKDVVFRLKDEIERVTGRGSCWIDLAGIESDKEFVDVIIEAIDQAETFLFMYSRHSDASEWTRKEVEYAQSEMKRIVFVRIDSEPLSKYYRFQFSGHDIIDLQDKDEKRKLLLNLKEWAGCSCEAGSPVEVSVDVLGLDFRWVNQRTNQVEHGSFRTSAANFNINLFSINLGICSYF